MSEDGNLGFIGLMESRLSLADCDRITLARKWCFSSLRTMLGVMPMLFWVDPSLVICSQLKTGLSVCKWLLNSGWACSIVCNTPAFNFALPWKMCTEFSSVYFDTVINAAQGHQRLSNGSDAGIHQIQWHSLSSSSWWLSSSSLSTAGEVHVSDNIWDWWQHRYHEQFSHWRQHHHQQKHNHWLWY